MGSLLLHTIVPKSGHRLAIPRGLACRWAHLFYDLVGLWSALATLRTTLSRESGRPPELHLLSLWFSLRVGDFPPPEPPAPPALQEVVHLAVFPSSITHTDLTPWRGEAGSEGQGLSLDYCRRVVPGSGCRDSPGALGRFMSFSKMDAPFCFSY